MIDEPPNPDRAAPPPPARPPAPESASSGDASGPPPKPRPVAPERAREKAGRRGGRGKERADPPPSEPARPTPVRQSLGSSGAEEAMPTPSRSFQADGRTWVVQVAGRGMTGSRTDRGAPLLHLTFHHDAGSSPPQRELLLVGTTLDVYDDDQLPELLTRARAYRDPPRPSRPVRRGRGRPRRD